jgi:hypothetical protein
MAGISGLPAIFDANANVFYRVRSQAREVKPFYSFHGT